MTLTEQQIKDIALNNPQKALVAAGQKDNKTLRMHMYGENIQADLPIVDGFESQSLHKLRIKYVKSNKDVMSRLGRPIDKIYSATGGSVYYNLPSDQESQARQLAMDVRGGYSLKKWVEMFWTPHFKDDPNGMLFMEVSPATKGQPLKTYPTYKSITSVFDYLPNGANLEYVFFTTTQAERKAAGLDPTKTIYRVVDDAFDYMVRVEGAEVTVLWEKALPNVFGYVPAMLNSDLVNPEGDCCMLSIFDDVIELAQQFLVKGSIKVTSDFMHAFPKYWEYADDCTDCGATGMIGGETCPACRGTKKKLMVSVSDVKALAFPDKDNPAVTPDVAGYVEPSKIFYEIAVQDLADLEDAMTYTMWGSHKADRTQTKGEPITATQAFIDTQPVNDRLKSISEMGERRHKFILDCLVRFSITATYQGSSISYGKRFIVEPPDVIWKKYSDARVAGASSEVLDDLLMEFFESKYAADPVKLDIKVKMMQVEPFVHCTVLEVQEFKPADEDWKAKLYYEAWRRTINDAMILTYSVTVLSKMLYDFTAEKDVTLAPPAPILPITDKSKDPVAA
jgi:hypothetical protein